MSDGKSVRLVTALVECRPDGEYTPWGVKWYDGRVYPFKKVRGYNARSWSLGDDRESESWVVLMADGTLREICHWHDSWYIVLDPEHYRPVE